MTEPTKEVKAALIQNELLQHRQVAYILTMRHKVAKRIDAPSDELKQIEELLLKTEKYIDAWETELLELEK
jgi:uncharacterized protein YPO0396